MLVQQTRERAMMELGRPNRVNKKRKAENSDNERLSKRLSLLNLERNGQRLYVPVEAPSSSSASSNSNNPSQKPFTTQDTSPAQSSRAPIDDNAMRLDDTKHKVYIYDLDAELSDSDTSTTSEDIVFLPDIRKHLRETRIPPSVLANQDGELGGMNKELVLYNVPSSLSVPEEQDGVRKAIIEARARMRRRMAGQVEDEDDGVQRRDFGRLPEPASIGGGEQIRDVGIPWSIPEDDVDAMDLG